MNIVIGDIFDSGADAIVHQVNCQGVMGAGLAKQIREKYPKVYKKYKSFCKITKPFTLLGWAQFVDIDNDKYIVNLFAQEKYGRSGCYTNYDALRKCMFKVNEKFYGKSVAIPYGIGCGLAGGDWEIVQKILEEELVDCYYTIYRLE